MAYLGIHVFGFNPFICNLYGSKPESSNDISSHTPIHAGLHTHIPFLSPPPMPVAYLHTPSLNFEKVYKLTHQQTLHTKASTLFARNWYAVCVFFSCLGWAPWLLSRDKTDFFLQVHVIKNNNSGSTCTVLLTSVLVCSDYVKCLSLFKAFALFWVGISIRLSF